MKPSCFIKTVYFRPEEAGHLAKWITDGFEKKVVYTVSQAYPYIQSQALFDQQIATSVIRPTRIWVMPLPLTTISGMDNSFPASIGPNIMTDFNIQLNGNPFYNQNIKSQYHFYREFRSQLIGAGSSSQAASPISYDDFVNGMNPYVFDLSRNPTVKSNNPNTIKVSGTVRVNGVPAVPGTPAGNAAVVAVAASPAVPTADIAAPYTLYVIIERLVTCTLRVSAGGIVVTTKDGAGFDDQK